MAFGCEHETGLNINQEASILSTRNRVYETLKYANVLKKMLMYKIHCLPLYKLKICVLSYNIKADLNKSGKSHIFLI